MYIQQWLERLAIATCCATASGIASAVHLEIDSGTVAEFGQTTALCVHMDTEGEAVAGTQNRIYWDPSCAAPLLDECRVNPAHGKPLYTAFHDAASNPRRPGTFVQTLVVSIEDTLAMPDGELYCCNFSTFLDAAGDCCEVRIEQLVASTPEGERIDPTSNGSGQICLDPDAPPRPPIVADIHTPTWTPSPQAWEPTATPTATSPPAATTPPTNTRVPTIASPLPTPQQIDSAQAAPDSDDDACQVARRGTAGLELLLLPALLLWARRRRPEAIGGR